MKLPKIACTVFVALGWGLSGVADTKDSSENIIPQREDGNFTLYVSNQSLALTPVDVTILIDGKRAVSGNFDVGRGENAQHRRIKHVLALTPGKHQLKILSKKGAATLEKEIEIKGKHWAVVDYWYYPESHYSPKPKQFSFDIQDKPIEFE